MRAEPPADRSVRIAGLFSARRTDLREPLIAISANAGRGIRSAAAATIPNVSARRETRFIPVNQPITLVRQQFQTAVRHPSLMP